MTPNITMYNSLVLGSWAPAKFYESRVANVKIVIVITSKLLILFMELLTW